MKEIKKQFVKPQARLVKISSDASLLQASATTTSLNPMGTFDWSTGSVN